MSFIKLFQVYALPVVFFIGIIGNGLSFVVMTRKSLRGQVASFYLTLLAVLDTVTLTSGIVPQWIFVLFEIEIRILSQAACKIFPLINFWLTDTVNWIVSLIAFDRFLNIIFPHKAKEWMTLRRSMWMSSIIILFLFFTNSQLLFIKTIEIKNDIENKTNLYCGFTSDYSYFIFSWIDLACFCIIPFTVITSCNAAIIFRLCLKKSRSVEQKMTSITLTLISVSLLLLVSTIPFEVYQLSQEESPSETIETEYLYVFSIFLIYLNNSINFFVYCLIGTTFRKELLKLFCKNRIESMP